jgi:hypothetical protein
MSPPYEKSDHASIVGCAAREVELPERLTVTREFFTRLDALAVTVDALKAENKRLDRELDALRKSVRAGADAMQTRLTRIIAMLGEMGTPIGTA